MPTKVVNVKDFPFEYGQTPYIYVGRYMPQKFAGHALANPFKLPRKATEAQRAKVLDQYREWLEKHPHRDVLLQTLAERVRRTQFPLGCWCAPLACHADILAAEVDRILDGAK